MRDGLLAAAEEIHREARHQQESVTALAVGKAARKHAYCRDRMLEMEDLLRSMAALAGSTGYSPATSPSAQTMIGRPPSTPDPYDAKDGWPY